MLCHNSQHSITKCVPRWHQIAKRQYGIILSKYWSSMNQMTNRQWTETNKYNISKTRRIGLLLVQVCRITYCMQNFPLYHICVFVKLACCTLKRQIYSPTFLFVLSNDFSNCSLFAYRDITNYLLLHKTVLSRWINPSHIFDITLIVFPF